MIDTEHVVQRFLKYVSFDTQSDEDNDAVCPSTPGQLVFAKALAEELKAIGLSDVTLDEHGYIMATLPANGAEGPVVGFISHVDTSPDASGKDIKPVRVTDYDGKDVVLNEAQGIVFSTKAFPEVLKYKGQDILLRMGRPSSGPTIKRASRLSSALWNTSSSIRISLTERSASASRLMKKRGAVRLCSM